MTIKIELFSSNICSRCLQTKRTLQALVDELGAEQFELHFIDVVENIDHAVEMRVLTTPSLAINGELIYSSMPSTATLRQRLRQEI